MGLTRIPAESSLKRLALEATGTSSRIRNVQSKDRSVRKGRTICGQKVAGGNVFEAPSRRRSLTLVYRPSGVLSTRSGPQSSVAPFADAPAIISQAYGGGR